MFSNPVKISEIIIELGKVEVKSDYEISKIIASH